jgi:asparagine synthase (glutamine-hydrolysing)
VLQKLDEPLGDASILPTYLLSSFARESVTVALAGDGGDELFAGYDPFAALRAAEIYNQMVPRWLHRGVRRFADLLPISQKNMSLEFKIRRTLMGLSYPQPIQLPVWMAPLEPVELAEFFEEPVDPMEVYSEVAELCLGNHTKDIVDGALEFFTTLYLQNDILTKVDRASMMCSLESRAVFLDTDLVEFCRRLPNHFKLRHGERKFLLKKAARRVLPAEIVDRKKKGFGIPLASWLQQMSFKPAVESLGGIGGRYAVRAWQENCLAKREHRLFLWAWLSAETLVSHEGYLMN